MESGSNGHSRTLAQSGVQVVGVHSYRGGSGKTTLAANLAFLLARTGAKVAVVDADLQAPWLHVALGVGEKRILHSLSEFVRGKCEIGEVPIDLTHELDLEGKGKLYFLPSSPELQTITSILFDGYDVARLNEQLRKLAHDLELDFLILDTHMGVNRETLLSLATADAVLVLLRPDGQDRQGAKVLTEIAKKVGVPTCLLVANMVSDADPGELSKKIEEELGSNVAGVLPWCQELEDPTDCGCTSLFAARQPEHSFTGELERIAQQLGHISQGADTSQRAEEPGPAESPPAESPVGVQS